MNWIRNRHGLLIPKRQSGFIVGGPAFFGSSSSGGDPYWSYVKSLLHFDGPNGSTSLIDEKGVAWTVSNASITTSIFKYGTGSFQGTGSCYALDDLSIGNGIGSGDFTFEFWHNPGIAITAGVLFTFGGGPKLGLYITSSGTLEWYENGSLMGTTTLALSASTWTFIAMTRSGTTGRIYIGGTQDSLSVTTSYDLSTIGCRLINENDLLTPMTGNMDEWRATAFCRYTSSFTPPTAAFPNF